jgi:hypothetical protein
MSTESAPILNDDRTNWTPWAIVAALLLLLVFGIIAFGTVRGCFFIDPREAAKLADEEKKKKEEEAKKKIPDFDLSSPIVMPSEPKAPLPIVKPGHWETISQTMKANYRDFVGDSRVSVINLQGQPYPIDNTPFDLRASRPVLLTKGRQKTTETTLYIPEAVQRLQIATDLEERGLGFGPPQPPTPLTLMPSYQYHFVVLAKEPARYSYIKTIDAIKSPFGGESDSDDSQDAVMYSVIPLKADTSVALPDNPLTWTSIAYVLWDEVNPGDPISPDQKKALVDWIHWGGQLIINGPDSLDLLKGSFLDPYLPATSGGPVKIAADDPAIAELNQHWLVSTKKAPGEPLKVNAPWSGIKLIPNADAKFLPNTGELLIERQVGRGRIVVSAVQLSERDLINWRSGFEGLFNACVLRRPARKYLPGYYGDVTLTWAAESLKDRRLDAALNTHLRFFARDLGVDTAYHYEDVIDELTQYNPRLPPQMQQQQRQTWRQYKPSQKLGGIGAWNDFSATAEAARLALREAAGVEVPNSDFVVTCLAAYLIALVPVNWIVFRSIGRVEWAWIAAPIIALAGTWIIVQRAQLDIGFVRAQTEIGLLEQQPDHPRAHLSRYTGLYTSLSTTYDFQSTNGTTLIAPFATAKDFQIASWQNLTPVNFQRYDDVRLVGLPISSNSTGMVHGEQMHTLDGAIRMTKPAANGSRQIDNGSKLDLRSACVVYRPTAAETKLGRGELEGKWIGELGPGKSTTVAQDWPLLVAKDVIDDRDPQKTETKPAPFAKERADDARRIGTKQLNLEPMFKLSLDPTFMEEGETRLVARVDQVLPGQTITPQASQVRGATLVVAHLQYPDPAAPEKDLNTSRDINPNDEPPKDDQPIEF